MHSIQYATEGKCEEIITTVYLLRTVHLVVQTPRSTGLKKEPVVTAIRSDNDCDFARAIS